MAGFQLKITLKATNPPVWRRLVVPCTSTFYDLHRMIQKAFQWDDAHMYLFEFKKLGKTILTPLHQALDEDEESADRVTIDRYFYKRGKCVYVYDFGDYWTHELTVEDLLPDYEEPFAQVLAYAEESLPEDCGGTGGYYRRLAASEAGDEEVAEWLEAVRPQKYDLEEINQTLAQLKSTGVVMDPQELAQLNQEKAYCRRLQTVLESMTREKLQNIAKRCRLPRYSTYKNRVEIITALAPFLATPGALEQALYTVSSRCVLDLEKAIEGDLVVAEQKLAGYFKLAELGLCSVMIDNTVIVPQEIAAGFRGIGLEAYKREHKRIKLVESYCTAATYLYGAVTLAEVAALFAQVEQTPVEEREIKEVLACTVSDKQWFVQRMEWLIDRELVSRPNVSELIGQTPEKRYLPQQKLVKDLGEEYVCNFNSAVGPLLEFAEKWLMLDHADALALAIRLHHAFRLGVGKEEMLEMVRKSDIEKQFDKVLAYQFEGMLDKAKKHTRQIALGGYTLYEKKTMIFARK